MSDDAAPDSDADSSDDTAPDSADADTDSADADSADTDSAGADGLAWETLDGGVDYRCPGFDVRRDEVRLPDGAETEFHYVDEPESVVVLPFTADGEVVLVEEWRQAVGRVNRGLPAGTVEADDADPVGKADAHLAAAARRELREETGYEAGSVEHVRTVEPVNGFANSVHHYFLARDCEPTAEQALDDDESIRPATADYAAFRDAVLAGEVRDGRAVLGVTAYEAGDAHGADDTPDGAHGASGTGGE